MFSSNANFECTCRLYQQTTDMLICVRQTDRQTDGRTDGRTQGLWATALPI